MGPTFGDGVPARIIDMGGPVIPSAFPSPEDFAGPLLPKREATVHTPRSARR